MVSFTVKGKQEARKAAMASIEALEKNMAANIDTIIHTIDVSLKELTPVHSGESVRNYIWTRGAPNTTLFEAIDNGPTGRTNTMSLGSEPRRSANESAAAETLAGLNVRGSPFDVFYLSNVAPAIEGLELGLLPGPPYQSRSPNGMFGITDDFINAFVSTRGITR